jgi:hypothetical protein
MEDEMRDARAAAACFGRRTWHYPSDDALQAFIDPDIHPCLPRGTQGATYAHTHGHAPKRVHAAPLYALRPALYSARRRHGMLGHSEAKIAVWVVFLHVAPEGLLAGQLRVVGQVDVRHGFHLAKLGGGDWA